MSEKYKVYDNSSAYFITFTLVEWIRLFHIPTYANIVVDSIKFCQENKGLELFAYCIMPSHIHLIARSEKQPFGNIVRDLKKCTARQIVLELAKDSDNKQYLNTFIERAKGIRRNKLYKVWQDGFHPEVIHSNQFFYQKLKYIHQNPVEAGLVSSQEDYVYSSVRNYAELKYVLEIVFEMPQLITTR